MLNHQLTHARPNKLASMGLVVMLGSLVLNALGDGGSIIGVEDSGDVRWLLLGPPTVVRDGLVDLDVILSDRSTGTVQSDERINGQFVLESDPAVKLDLGALDRSPQRPWASRIHTRLPKTGRWILWLRRVNKSDQPVGFPVEVREPQRLLSQLWPWLTWPWLVVGLFLLRESGRHRREAVKHLDGAPIPTY